MLKHQHQFHFDNQQCKPLTYQVSLLNRGYSGLRSHFIIQSLRFFFIESITTTSIQFYEAYSHIHKTSLEIILLSASRHD